LSDDFFSDGKTQNASSTQQLWGPAQDAAKSIFGGAANAYNSSGTMNPAQKAGLSQTVALSKQGVPNLKSLLATQGGMLKNGGYTSQMTDAAGLLRGTATAEPGQNPYIREMMQYNADQAGNAAATKFGGGRYGSAAIGNGLGSAVANANTGLQAQAYEGDMGRRLQAQGLLGQLASTGADNMETWSSMSPMLNELRYDGANRLSSAGDAQANFKWDRLGKYAGTIGQLLGLNSTTNSTGTAQSNPSTARQVSTLLGFLGSL
jgi:hypothetical protein